MFDEEWDADNFEPREFTIPRSTNKWDGEDEEEDGLKDNWFDDEKKDEEPEKKPEPETISTKKKKEKEKSIQPQIEMQKMPLTPEEEVAEKLKRQKLQEDSDLSLVKEAFGVTEEKGFDAMKPESEEEFKKLEEAIVQKITSLEESKYYFQFVENLIRSLCVELNMTTLKKLKSIVESVYFEKTKQEKAEKLKKKGKGGLKLKVERVDDIFVSGMEYGGEDDYDDFM